jgi:hypothetical protein
MKEALEQKAVSNQFSIKRLFWTLIVASVIFKLADMTGLMTFVSDNWDYARGGQKLAILLSIIAFALVSFFYIGWLGIRLPWLIERQLIVRRKRNQRREKLRQEIEAWRNQ